MTEVLRIGAVARVDPNPETELAVWRRDVHEGRIDDPRETRRRLAEYEHGDWVIVRLDLFADLADARGMRRLDGVAVRGCWFSTEDGEHNVLHAREMIGDHLEQLQRELADSGQEIPLATLIDQSVTVELDPSLRRRLHVNT